MGAHRQSRRAPPRRGARGRGRGAKRRLNGRLAGPAAATLAFACLAAAAAAAPRAGHQGSPSAGPRLFVAGTLADSDHRPLRQRRASATILASRGGPGATGIASIAVLVDGKPVVRRRERCAPRCPASARLRFTYRRKRFGGGRHRVRIEATDGAGAVARRTIEVEPVPGGRATGAPPADPAYYITAANPASLRHQAYGDASQFARQQTGGRGLLILDFGAARHRGSRYGVRLRGGTFFSDAQVHDALQSAARGYHAHRRRGSATLVYAASNALLGSPGLGDTPLNPRTAREAGRRQALALRGLRLDSHTSAAVGGDIEPGYDLIAPPRVSVSLVAGAVAGSRGGPYYDVGTAPCAGTDCTNGWTLNDICSVAAGRGRRALPEIYYGPPTDQAGEWAAVAKRCNIRSFAGVSGSVLGDFTPSQSWKVLRRAAQPGVGRVVVVWPR